VSTLQDLVLGFRAAGDRTALIWFAGGAQQSLSYADLVARAERLARGMLAAGIKPGDPVILFGPNSADWIVTRLALALVGAIAVAFDDLLTDAEVKTLTPDSGAAIAFASDNHIPRLKAAAPGLRILKIGEELPDDANAKLPALGADQPEVLVYTSGTTGTPKSFLLTHANLLANITAIRDQGLVSPDDRVLLPLPLHHVYPLTVGCLSVFACGTTLVLPESVSGPDLVAALKAARITVIIGVPRLYAALLAGIEGRLGPLRPLLALSIWIRRRLGLRTGRLLLAPVHRRIAPELRLLASGGAKFEAELIWRLEGVGWEVLSGYGLAETASILTNNHHGKARIGSEGWPLPGAEIRIADGEIQARGPSVFKGYRNNPEADATAFTADGWFRTGDLGRVDDDGYVFVTGRMKEMIVLGGGKNVFPEEVEKVYANPLFKEIAVLERNGALVALVMPDEAAIVAGGNARIDDAVRVTLAERGAQLAQFQRVSGFAITRNPLPRTRLGKYRRFELGPLYERAKAGDQRPTAAEPTAEDRALLETSPAREVWAWLQARYPQHKLYLDLSPQLDLGIDSLEWVTLSIEMAERFGIRISEEQAANAHTLRDLIALTAKPQPAVAAPQREITPPGPLGRAIGLVLLALDKALMRTLFRLRVSGRAPDQPCIIACNHVSDLDPLIVAAALPLGQAALVWWGADAQRVFGSPAYRWITRIARTFPIDERQPVASLAYAQAVLKRGDTLVWFPEGWRSPDGELQRFMPGLGHLLAQGKVRVVPARISGAFAAWPRSRSVPRPAPIAVSFGPPLESPTPDQVRDAIARLPRPHGP